MKTATAFALNTGQQLAKIGCEINHLKSRTGCTAADVRQAGRKALHSAEDALDEVAYRIKRQPLKAIGITAGVAFGIGALTGWLVTRN